MFSFVALGCGLIRATQINDNVRGIAPLLLLSRNGGGVQQRTSVRIELRLQGILVGSSRRFRLNSVEAP